MFLVTLWRRTIFVPRSSYWYDSWLAGGYMHKSICNSMLLGLNAFYEWGQCFLSEPWYDDPVRICFGSPMCVNGSVIPDCWAFRPFYWSIMWQVLRGRWKFLRWNCTSVLWLNTMNSANAECCWRIWKISTSWLAYNSTLRFVKMHRINPGGSGEEANEPVFTDSGLGALGFSSSYERRRFALRRC